MMPMVHAQALEALIALASAGTLTGAVLRMLRPLRPIPVEAAGAVLVPVTGSSLDQREVEWGCQLAEEQHAAVVLVYVIEVPLTLPLEMPLEQAESDARQALASAMGTVMRHGLPVRTVVRRDRGVREAMTAAARECATGRIV